MDVLKEFHKIVAQRRNVSQQVFVEKSIRETENINAGITSKKIGLSVQDILYNIPG